MKLMTFEVPSAVGHLMRVGADTDDGIIDLAAAYAALFHRDYPGSRDRAAAIAESRVPSEMVAFLAGGRPTLDLAEEAVTYVQELRHRTGVALGPKGEVLSYSRASVRTVAPLLRPNAILEFPAFTVSRGDELVFERRNTRTVHGPGVKLPWPSFADRIDCTASVAAIIGKRGINIPREEAWQYIAGFSLRLNAVAYDDDGQELKPGKATSWFSALGPAIVTVDDALTKPVEVTLEHDSVVRATRSTADMVWSWDELVEFASLDEELAPGDVISAGAVGTVSQHGVWLTSGAKVGVACAGIGAMEIQIGPRHQTSRISRSQAVAR